MLLLHNQEIALFRRGKGKTGQPEASFKCAPVAGMQCEPMLQSAAILVTVSGERILHVA